MRERTVAKAKSRIDPASNASVEAGTLPAAQSSTDDGTTLSFEATIAELGQIVEQLERGDLPLEQSLDLFERGMRLSKDAQTRLDAAEKRVEMLLGFDASGEPLTRELDPDGPQ